MFVVVVLVVVVVVVRFAFDIVFTFEVALAAFATVLAAFAMAFAAWLAVVAAWFIAFATFALRLAFAVFVFAASPQAIPKAPNAKSDESAINFFMLKLILLSSSKINYLYFYLRPFFKQPCSSHPILGTLDNINSNQDIVNLIIVKKCIFEVFFAIFRAKRPLDGKTTENTYFMSYFVDFFAVEKISSSMQFSAESGRLKYIPDSVTAL